MSKSLPSRPNLEQLKQQAKDLLKQFVVADSTAVDRVREFHPDFGDSSVKTSKAPSAASENNKTAGGPNGGKAFRLNDAQLVIAREYGFASWARLKQQVEAILLETADPMEQFKQAFTTQDAPKFRELLARFPAYKARINDPVAAFDAPVITQVRTREMLDVLLEAGADINARSRWWAGGFGLLDCAEPDLAQYAIQRGAVVDVHAAARLGKIDNLRAMVAADPQLVHARGGDGQTPLHFASNVAVAAFLIDHGADIDAKDVDHESTPAQYMIRDRQEIVRLLIRRGCKTDLLLASAVGDLDLVRRHLDDDPDCIRTRVSDEYFPKANFHSGGTIYQWTLGWHVSAHDVARQFKHDDVLRLLMERSPAEVKLIAACWGADESAANGLVANNPGIVTRLSAAYRRQVAHAARNNNSAVVRLMLAVGLPVDARGQHQGTPLHWAGFHGNAEMTREILRYNPPLELTDADFKSTPLGWVVHGSEHGWYCRTGDYAGTVELLILAGAKLPGTITRGSEAVREVLQRHGVPEAD